VHISKSGVKIKFSREISGKGTSQSKRFLSIGDDPCVIPPDDVRYQTTLGTEPEPTPHGTTQSTSKQRAATQGGPYFSKHNSVFPFTVGKPTVPPDFMIQKKINTTKDAK